MSKKIIYKTREEIELMREAAQLVSRTLGMLAEHIRPGVTPLQLDALGKEYILDHGGRPAFLGLYGFPNSLCIGVNENVIHGIPTDRPLENGDIVSVDCGVVMNGFCGDHAFTYPVGEVEPKVDKLLRVTRKALELGIEQAVVGNRIGAISHAIQRHAQQYGYGVVEQYVGHGLGRDMHEGPEVPNFGRPSEGATIREGLVIAIEPMINMGTKLTKQLRDKWTVVTADGKPSAHFEHNVAIVDGKPDVLSTFQYIEEALAKVA